MVKRNRIPITRKSALGTSKKKPFWRYTKLSAGTFTTGAAEQQGVYSLCDFQTLVAALAADNERCNIKKVKCELIVKSSDFNYVGAGLALIAYRSGGTFTGTTGAAAEWTGFINGAINQAFSVKFGPRTSIPKVTDRWVVTWDITQHIRSFVNKNVETAEGTYTAELILAGLFHQDASKSSYYSSTVVVDYDVDQKPLTF